ncbi:MAG: hypothetical protein ACYC5Y_12375 [Symbiobacteriia bacterium]
MASRTSQWRRFALVDQGRLPLPLSKDRLLLALVAFNFAILFVDVAIAHSQNHYFPRYEWIPLIYSPFAAAAAGLAAAWDAPPPWVSRVHAAIMVAGFFIGILGTVFHALGSMVPGLQPALGWAIYGSPVMAPLSFAGVALVGLVLVSRYGAYRGGPPAFDAPLPDSLLSPKTRLLLLLVALGFLVTTLVSLLDHARTGFHIVYTWIPVVTGFLGFFITLGLSRIKPAREETASFAVAMLLSMFVGLVGFGLHIAADVARGGGALQTQRLFYQAPLLAPLLFANLGLFGLLAALEPVPVRSEVPETDRTRRAPPC